MIIKYQMLEKLFLLLMHKLPEELAHRIAINLLKLKLIPPKKKIYSSLLETKIFGFVLSNPIGLAAGFDKNAEALPGLLNQNFSYIEVGTVTPLAQYGNEKPRVFRVLPDKSIINKLGFPNIGEEKVFNNLKKIRKNHPLGKEPIIGVNIGCNKKTKNPLKDFEKCFETFYQVADYITINISSPNTPGLRNLQYESKLIPLLKGISLQRDLFNKKIKRKIPLILKISPDLEKKDIKSIVDLSIKYKFQGIIATNTTIKRKLAFTNNIGSLEGGASGKVLFPEANKTLKYVKEYAKDKIEIIGVGGVNNSYTLLHKISLGANAIQLYTALVYQGIGLIEEILLDLIKKQKKSGNKKLSELIGKND